MIDTHGITKLFMKRTALAGQAKINQFNLDEFRDFSYIARNQQLM